MILTPFDAAMIALLGAVLTRTQEPTMQTANDFARRMALLGKPGPYKSSPHNPGCIVDRADDILLIVSPTISGTATRRDAAEIAALALNRLCGFAAVEDRLDPAHIAAVQAESDRFMAQTRPQAAE
ncbi:hypothetical protein [Methylobacterium pseudosasicola]|uniref:Uncharacterized protein n=1 Tax=Methylobacterium pseudosasicola TaxID=582667 RepID=A0A1I4URK3_9HYPH|nr:hypothetical protein [Methylobacterium pseudosasicola]SFM91614.1 hypothetical protein SAMN05192568_107526 [Methylobacterium pseudosasicola]